MSLLGGRLCEVANTNPLLPLLCTNPLLPPLFVYSDQGGGHVPLYPFAMPVPVVQP